MKPLPERSNLDHLKRQAKDLLRLYRNQDSGALARFRDALPAAAGKSDSQIIASGLRLHDAQSCVAREYGFPSWEELRSFVAARRESAARSPGEPLTHWLRLTYSGELAGATHRARPAAAARWLAETPSLAEHLERDPFVACAAGDEPAVRKHLAADASWINRPGGPLALPPLVAVTHSSLLRLPEFHDGLLRCARLLLEAGADPNQSVGSRWPPASLSHPSSEHRLSALYGAAGLNHDPELTRLLLAAGADPNDGESLYHSLEDPECTRLLLAAGARIKGSNAMYRVLDLENVAVLEMLLSAGGDPNEPALFGPATADFGSPLLWGIRRRRSPAHIQALLRAGANPAARTAHGVSAYRLALQFGLTQVAALLQQAGGADELSLHEQLIAACARGSESDARGILSQHPGILAKLSESELRLLPDLAEAGAVEAVKAMVRIGWPIAARGGDWQATALNLAVFRGDPELTRFLLEHGASWTEQHGFGDDVSGTLSWASCNEPLAGGDWLGCAQALVEHGMPRAARDPETPGCVLMEGRRKRFSEEVTDFLLE